MEISRQVNVKITIKTQTQNKLKADNMMIATNQSKPIIPQGLKYICKKSLKGQLIEGEYYYIAEQESEFLESVKQKCFVNEDRLSYAYLPIYQVSRYLKQIKNFPITPELDKHLKEIFSKADYKIVYLTLAMFNAIYTIEDFVDEDTGQVVTITRQSIFNTKKSFYAKKNKNSYNWTNILTRKQYLKHSKNDD